MELPIKFDNKLDPWFVTSWLSGFVSGVKKKRKNKILIYPHMIINYLYFSFFFFFSGSGA